MYQPLIFSLESGNSDILNDKPNEQHIILSSTINIPLNSLGFHTFLHRTKNAMSITKNMQSKNQIFYIVNPFEQIESDDVNEYLNIKKNVPNIISRNFYIYWEILFMFDIDDDVSLNFVSLSNEPDIAIQTIINYRQKLKNNVKNDNMYSVSFNPTSSIVNEFYNKQNSKIINKQTGGDIMNLTDFKTNIVKNKQLANLIIADSELMKVDDENYIEQESYKLLLEEIITILKSQDKNGNLVLKIFETFTLPTIKLIYLLSSFYNETNIYKPFFSRPTNSEKFLICKKFKFSKKEINDKIKSLENVLELMNTNKFIFDIYPDLIIPNSYLNVFKFINIKIANQQQIMINDIVKYIKENNYYGDKYHNYKEKQNDATKWWKINFFPPSSNVFIKNKEDINKLLTNSLNKYNIELSNFINSLL